MPLTERERELLRLLFVHAYADLSPVETWRRLREGLPALAEFAERVSQQ